VPKDIKEALNLLKLAENDSCVKSKRYISFKIGKLLSLLGDEE
jgi:hypothetical protein